MFYTNVNNWPKTCFSHGPQILEIQHMNNWVNTRDAAAVRRMAQRVSLELFPPLDTGFVRRAFDWAVNSFLGKYKDYQPIDALYHDLEHTLQGTLCLVSLLQGRAKAGIVPELDRRHYELAVLAILLHDTGYLKRNNDVGGTGAKYTYVHVGRSAEFARELLVGKGFTLAEISSVQNMIRCTGVKLDIDSIPFHSELERELGQAVGTADLLGQMAAEDYPRKLTTLFLEFEEAARRDPDNATGHARFETAGDLIRNTPAFWEHFVRPKLDNELGGAHRHLCDDDGNNPYIDRIESNIEQIRRKIAELPESDLAAA